MKILLARMPAALIALASAALVGLATGMPVSGDLVPRGPVPGIQMWSGADFSGNFFHYSGPAIRFDACYDITGRFPPGQWGGLMAVKADPQNWCTIFPNKVCNPGSGSDADRLWVIGSYYDLSNPEYGWGERAQSFSCKSCPNCRN